MDYPTLKELRVHLMDHVQELTKLQHQLLGIKRQVLTSYHALDGILTEQDSSADLPATIVEATNRLSTMRAGMRAMIESEEDLPENSEDPAQWKEIGVVKSPHGMSYHIVEAERPPCAECGKDVGDHPEFACERYVEAPAQEKNDG